LLVGALVGAALSIAALRLFYVYGGQESETGMISLSLYVIIEWPAYKLWNLMGLDWPIGGRVTWVSLSIIVATNSLLAAVAGAALGSLLALKKNRNLS
jgi:hypothetical protein